MILFYNKKTREIIGHIEGRVHPIDVKKTKLEMTGVPQEDIVKYVVPFKPNFEIVKVDKTEMRVVDKKTMRVESVVVGKEKVKRQTDMSPDVPFADIITLFEENTENLQRYKVKLDSKNNLVGFEKNTQN